MKGNRIMAKRKIDVLIVDDSLFFREFITKELSKDEGLNIVGTAADAFEARDKIVSLNPQVLILDVEMPKMNGIDFLLKLMPQHPIPVIVVSSISSNVFDAMRAGAVDFVSKPDFSNQTSKEAFIRELVIKTKIASIAKVAHFKKDPDSSQVKGSLDRGIREDLIIAIGASTGGTEAIYQVLKGLPKETPPVVIVQHMPPIFTRMYAERLNNSCELYVKEAENGDFLAPGKVLIAPGDFHMRLVKKGARYAVECFTGEKINGLRPAVDVLFNSVAELAKKNAIGVILTGMGADGAKGLLKMRENGAYTIGQDEASCVVYGMPKAAFDMGAVEKQLPLNKISEEIIRLSKK
ncbi:MAG: chemotaxis response regulator protein-glutamate methylesterase [Clostridiaceae bacterium]|nr:chemotaxis response regulator protein-glutamate methylesterase [Clostridiaceae bacterium]